MPPKHRQIERRKHFVPGRLPRESLNRGELCAEIIEDRRRDSPLYICVVQKLGSCEVLFIGQFGTRAEARSAAKIAFAESRIARTRVLIRQSRGLARASSALIHSERRTDSVQDLHRAAGPAPLFGELHDHFRG